MMIDILKLDEESLTLERGVLLAAIEADIANGEITAENVTAEIQRFR